MSAAWLPIESTPEVLNPFLRQLGCPPPWGADVYGLDEALLAMVPQPCAALILLFPCTALSSDRRRELRSRRADQPLPPPELFFAQQHDECGNACGTIALIHAVVNAATSGSIDLDPNSPLLNFLHDAPSDTYARGRALVAAESIRNLSNNTAAAGQTHGAGTEDNQGQHYIALVPIAGLLWELDGRNIDDDGIAFPFCHGATSESTFLADAAVVVQEHFIKRDPSNPNFSMLALAKLDDA